MVKKLIISGKKHGITKKSATSKTRTASLKKKKAASAWISKNYGDVLRELSKE